VNFLPRLALQKKKKLDSSRLHVEIALVAWHASFQPLYLENTCNSAHEQIHLSNDTIDFVLRHREVGRAKDLSAPPRTAFVNDARSWTVITLRGLAVIQSRFVTCNFPLSGPTTPTPSGCNRWQQGGGKVTNVITIFSCPENRITSAVTHDCPLVEWYDLLWSFWYVSSYVQGLKRIEVLWSSCYEDYLRTPSFQVVHQTSVNHEVLLLERWKPVVRYNQQN